MKTTVRLLDDTKPEQTACTLKIQQESDAILLKDTQRDKANTLMRRLEADPVNDMEKHHSHAASVLKESQSKAALALRESQDTAACALKESQEGGDKKLSDAKDLYAKTLKEKEQIIGWMAGGYSA